MTSRRVPAVHAGPAARASAVVVAVRSLFSKKTHSLQENSKNSWHVDHSAERCTEALGDTCSGARGESLDTLHRNVLAGRNGNKHAMVPTRQGAVLTAAAAVGTSATAAADAARGAVRPTAADDAPRGAVKLTPVDTAREVVKSTAADDAVRGVTNPIGANMLREGL